MLSSAFDKVARVNMFTKIDTRHYLRGKLLLDVHGDGNYKDYVGLYDHKKSKYPFEKGYTPKVSCICPTFGRTEYLGEAIWHFLGQDYPNKELIILNDNKDITYECDIPNVVVVNKSEIYPSLGLKRNAASELATGHFLVPWDDDDIHLPHRISSLVTGIKERTARAFYTPPFVFFHTRGQKAYLKSSLLLPHIPGGAHATCIYSKSIFNKVGGYGDHDLGEDAVLFRAFRNAGVDMTAGDDDSHANYVYNNGSHPKTGKQTFMPDLHRTVVDKGIIKLIPRRSPYTTAVLKDMGDIFARKRLSHDAWYKLVK
jgi:glycosyltransferase involved in cell wall biosynthesis